MESRILREAMLAYQAVYDEELREELEEKRLVNELVPEIFETIAYALISQGHSAIDVLEYFSYVDENVIIEDVIALSEGNLIVESVVSEEYIEEQFRQLDEVLGPLAAAAGAGLRALARPALSFAAKQAPKVASAATKLGQRAANAVWKSGSKATPMGRFPAGTSTAPGTKLLGQKNILQKAGGAVSSAVGKVKDVARGALNKLPGGSKGKFAGALKTAANFAVPGLAFELGKASGGGGKGPATAKPKPGADKSKYNASAALGGKTAFQAGGGAAAMKKNPNLTAADIQKKGTAALRSSAGGDLAKGAQLFKSKQEIMSGKPSTPAKSPTTQPSSSKPSGSGGRPPSSAPSVKPPAAKPSATKPPAGTPPVAKPTKIQQDVEDLRRMQSSSMMRQQNRNLPSGKIPTGDDLKPSTPSPTTKPTPTATSTPTSKSTPTNRSTGSRKPGSIVSGFDMFDLVKGHLLDEGYADTEEAAIKIMANMSEEWRESILDEALTGERYKKVMKKPGGTSYSRKVSADPAKRATRGGKGGESDFGAGDRGSGNKAARRAGTYQEEYVDEAQHARENPEKYEREQAKKSAPVRGERTPMPPRGDKRREDFEKWYAKNVR